MAIEFKLPELGENVAGGDVTRVMVKVGDRVKQDQAVLEMETGKATVEIPTSVAGVVKAIHVKEGTKAKVGQLILTLDPDGAASTPASAAPAPKKAEAPKASPAAPPPPPPTATRAPAPSVAQPPVVTESGRQAVAASPSTRQFAREIGVDASHVGGTGPGGRVSTDDVKAHARSLNAGQIRGGGKPIQPTLPDFSKWGETEIQPLNALRQAVAEHMATCWSTIPHVTLHDKADITSLEKLRGENKTKAKGAKLTVTAFLIKIVASALKAHPKFNSSIDTTANELILRKYVHIGVAMDTEKGLSVPVIRDADRKNVIQIAAELTQLSGKAREGKVSLAEMQGGCFSVTNLGGIGGGFFTPIVNFPEVAILGVGRAAMEPVMIDGFFQARLMMPLSLSFDHRVVDGADGARFLQWIINAIQKPIMMTLEG